MKERDSLFDSLPPIFAEYVKWLLDRDPEYAAELIKRWEADRV